ncbi:MAG: hypothetical protein LBT48_02590 [Prevotellaceae bacterium]|jgi:recombination DNA repair RAD52 pathway protein|nr:hypothetical protein [Prevotellaceae bacterium]
MEDFFDDVIARLTNKHLRLIALYEKIKSENEVCRNEKQAFEDEIDRQRAVIEKLEERNKKLQLAEAFKVSSADTNDAKQKIGRIVKEIDKCVALLNR